MRACDLRDAQTFALAACEEGWQLTDRTGNRRRGTGRAEGRAAHFADPRGVEAPLEPASLAR